MISAHYGLSEVFDNLVISLCKFTTFLNSAEVSWYNFTVTVPGNQLPDLLSYLITCTQGNAVLLACIVLLFELAVDLTSMDILCV